MPVSRIYSKKDDGWSNGAQEITIIVGKYLIDDEGMS